MKVVRADDPENRLAVSARNRRRISRRRSSRAGCRATNRARRREEREQHVQAVNALPKSHHPLFTRGLRRTLTTSRITRVLESPAPSGRFARSVGLLRTNHDYVPNDTSSVPKSRPSSTTRARRRTVLALGPAIVVLILGAITFDGIRRSSQSRALVAHTRDIIDRAQSTLSALQDAETGERGFLITGEPSYLEPYDRGVSSLASDTTALRALTKDNAAQQRRLDSLDVLILERMQLLATGIAFRKVSGLDSARTIVASGRGKALMDAIRVQLGEVISTERALLEQRQSNEADHARLATLILGIGTLAAVLLSLMLNGLLLRSAATEVRLSQEVDARNKQLETQNLELEL